MPINPPAFKRYVEFTLIGTDSADNGMTFFRGNKEWVMEEIQCEEVRKKLPDYRERLLKHPEKGQIERHLYYCPECIFQLALVTARSLEKIPTPL